MAIRRAIEVHMGVDTLMPVEEKESSAIREGALILQTDQVMDTRFDLKDVTGYKVASCLVCIPGLFHVHYPMYGFQKVEDPRRAYDSNILMKFYKMRTSCRPKLRFQVLLAMRSCPTFIRPHN